MSNKDQTLPGGFQGAEHPLGEDRAQTSTPPPDSRQSFDPYEFGAHTVSPSLRMELIKTQLPETPAERLYHSPASEARKTSSPVAAPAATASFAGVVRDRRVQVAGVAALLVAVALLLPRACGDQSEVASALQRAAPSVPGTRDSAQRAVPQSPSPKLAESPALKVSASASPSPPAAPPPSAPSERISLPKPQQVKPAARAASSVGMEDMRQEIEMELPAGPAPNSVPVEPTAPSRTLIPEPSATAAVSEPTPHRKQVRVKAR
jgi:hypothetical protein